MGKYHNKLDKKYFNKSIYIKKFDGLDEKTFMYAEEELLLLKLKKNKMFNYYNPNVEICHLEYSSTNSIPKADYTRFSRMLEANKILLEEIKKNE